MSFGEMEYRVAGGHNQGFRMSFGEMKYRVATIRETREESRKIRLEKPDPRIQSKLISKSGKNCVNGNGEFSRVVSHILSLPF